MEKFDRNSLICLGRNSDMIIYFDAIFLFATIVACSTILYKDIIYIIALCLFIVFFIYVSLIRKNNYITIDTNHNINILVGNHYKIEPVNIIKNEDIEKIDYENNTFFLYLLNNEYIEISLYFYMNERVNGTNIKERILHLKRLFIQNYPDKIPEEWLTDNDITKYISSKSIFQ